MAKSPYRLLFVCMGNICRSPAAEGVMRSIVKSNGAGTLIECDSAGTIGLHEGNPSDSRMRRAARARGIELNGTARQVRESDFAEFDLILTMDEENFAGVTRIGHGTAGGATVRRFCEYLTEHDESEIPDPYYGGDEGFEHVLDLLEDGCAELLRSIADDSGGITGSD